LVGLYARSLVDGAGIETPQYQVCLGANDKECRRLGQPVEADEIQVPSVHHVNSAGLGHDHVKDVTVVRLAVINMQKRRDIAAQVDLRVQLDGCLGALKVSPRKQCQAQIDGGGVERVGRVLKVSAERLACVELACLPDQALGEGSIETPVALLVGIGQRRASNVRAKAHMVELVFLSVETNDSVSETFAPSELRKGHGTKLVLAAEALDRMIAVEAHHEPAKRVHRQVINELCENQLAFVHAPSSRSRLGALSARGWENRLGPIKSMTPRNSRLCVILQTIVGSVRSGFRTLLGVSPISAARAHPAVPEPDLALGAPRVRVVGRV
jgi:hypothetical protein